MVSLPFRGAARVLSGKFAIAITPVREGMVMLRTSWLPHDPGAPSEALRDAGFVCERGSFVATVARDDLAVERFVRLAVRVFLKSD